MTKVFLLGTFHFNEKDIDYFSAMRRVFSSALALCPLKYYNKARTSVLRGVLTAYLVEREVVPMKNYTFRDLITFGIFLLALLTFIFKFS